MSEDLKHDKITCVNSGTAVHSYIQTFMLWFGTSSVDHTIVSQAIPFAERERKGLVTLQLLSCHQGIIDHCG